LFLSLFKKRVRRNRGGRSMGKCGWSPPMTQRNKKMKVENKAYLEVKLMKKVAVFIVVHG